LPFSKSWQQALLEALLFSGEFHWNIQWTVEGLFLLFFFAARRDSLTLTGSFGIENFCALLTQLLFNFMLHETTNNYQPN
jgi:hypothetical protein